MAYYTNSFDVVVSRLAFHETLENQCHEYCKILPTLVQIKYYVLARSSEKILVQYQYQHFYQRF